MQISILNAIGGGSTPTPSTFSNTLSTTFDGIDAFVDCGNDSSLQMSGKFSISIWLKYSAAFTGYAFSGCGNKYGIYMQSNLINLQHRNTSNVFKSVSSTSAFNDGNWHHVLGVNDGTNLLLYIDGVLNNSNALGGASITSTLSARIGSISTTSGWEFSGNIDEVAVWNSDQSANVSAIYNSGVPNDISSLSPLSWWRCGDEDTSPTLTDNGSGGNDGTMTNFTTFSTDVPT